MNQRITSLLLAAALVTTFVACDKDDNELPNQQERWITAKEWKIQDITRKSLANPNQDSSIIKECSGDDRLAFSANHNFQLKDGTTKCDSAIFKYDTGSWTYSPAQNQLVLTGNIKVQKWQVQTLNDSVMKVQWLDSIAVDNKVLKTIHLKNK